MRPRYFGVFAVGFAAGMACLCVVLWAAGALRTGPASPFVQRANRSPQLPAPSPAELAAKAQKEQPHIPIAPPPIPGTASAAAASGATGEADRSMEDADRYAFNIDGPLAMPIQGLNPATLSDTFSDRRDGHYHDALDISAPRNTPVHAVVEGNVVKLFTSKEGGLTVYQFDDSGKYCYYYAHLDHYAPGLKEGMLLRKGDVLGYVGTTGDAPKNAPHLHFAVFQLGPDKKWWQGTAIDPLPLLRE